MRCDECGGKGGFMSWADNADVEVCYSCKGTGRKKPLGQGRPTMTAQKGTGKNIAYAVTYKAATELVTSGVVEFDNEDIGANLAELADLLFEHYEKRLDQETPRGGGGKGKPRRSTGRSQSSNKGGYNRSGSSSSSGGGDRPPSAKQVSFVTDLLLTKDHGFDISVDEDENILAVDGKQFDDLSGKEVSGMIEELLKADDL